MFHSKWFSNQFFKKKEICEMTRIFARLTFSSKQNLEQGNVSQNMRKEDKEDKELKREHSEWLALDGYC